MRFLCLFLILASNLVAQSTNELFSKASVCYENMEYDSALVHYKSIENMPVFSSDLYYNMANCYYKKQQTALAVLYFEKALKLKPNDEDIQFNLKLVQLQLVDRLAVIPTPFYTKWMSQLKLLFSIDQWAKIGLLFFFLFSIGISWFLISTNYLLKKKLFSIFVLSLILSIGTLAMAYYSYGTQKNTAILMSANAYVKSAPSLQSEDLFILHEGTKVEVVEVFNNWTKIKLSDGMIGWLENELIAPI